MSKLILTLAVIVLIVVTARDPEGMGHLVQAVVTVGAKVLDAVASILTSLVGR